MKFNELINKMIGEDKDITLQDILDSEDLSSRYEEDAEDYLHDKDVSLESHSRDYILKLAWKHGWRP